VTTTRSDSPSEKDSGKDADKGEDKDSTDVSQTDSQRQMNEAMAAQAEKDAADAATPQYPAGAEELTAENVRRYPDLFTDEQKASIPNEELPETDIEKAQREQAEKAEQDEAEAKKAKKDEKAKS
jgi:hypothetical protein